MQEKAKMAEVAAAREGHTLFHHEHVGVKNEQQRGLLVKEQETTIGAKVKAIRK